MANPTSKVNLVVNGVTTQLDVHDANAVPLAGTNALAGSIVPDTDNSYDLGSSSYKLRYVYAGTAYVTNLNINGAAAGDIMTHNASEFVDVTTEQTIGGVKTFSNVRTYFGRDISCYSNRKYGKNLNPASNTYQYLNFSGNTVSDGPTNDWSSGYLEQVVDTNGGARGRWFVQDTSENAVGLELWASGNDKQVRPYQNNNTILGIANKRWKDCYTNAINGLNPSDLSLPSDTSITIDTTGFAWGANFTFTPSVNGYLFISIAESTGIRKLSLKTGRGEYCFSNQTGILRFTTPVYKDKLVTILAASSIAETVVPTLTLFPCQGNV